MKTRKIFSGESLQIVFANPTVVFRPVVVLALVCLDLSLIQPAFGQSYTVTDLGVPGGFSLGTGANSVAHAINDSGCVAGEWGPDSNSERAFLFTGNTNTDLGLLPGMQYQAAYDINASNLVVGMAENNFGAFRAFIYTNGTLVDLTTFPQQPGNYTYSLAHAINAAGTVVGESYTSSGANAEIHAVIFLGNGQQTDLGTLTNGTYSVAYGINNSNVIVGESTVGSSANVYAFVYSNGVMTAVGTFSGGNYSAAFAISDTGQIAGEANTSSGDTHAFLFKNGVMTDLGTLGGTSSSAIAINNAGQVVGYATTASGDQHAFLSDGTNMLDLNNLISPSICTNLVSADGINDSGQIAGSGYTPSGDFHAFLLTPVTVPALALTNPKVLTNRQFQMTVQGAPGEQFILLGSTNLINWLPLVTNTLTANSTNWSDSDTLAHEFRFYRALTLPQ